MKNVVYNNETEKEALEYTCKLVDFGVSLLIFSAFNELLNAFILLRESKYYVHTVKRRSKVTLKLLKRKEEDIKKLSKDRGFSESYYDAIIDVCETDINTLRQSVKATMDEHDIDNSELYSQAETARILLQAAKMHYEEVIRDVTNRYRTKNLNEMRRLDLFKIFREFYVADIYKEWNAVCEILYDYKSETVDLNTEATTEAYNSLAEKFAKGLFISDCLKIAQKEFPQYSDAKIKVTD